MPNRVNRSNLIMAAILLATTAALAPGAAAQSVVVPDVVGLQLGVAEPTILAAGLIIGNVTFQESFVVPVGQVMSQQPLALTGALVGTPVNLVVSAGVVAAIVPAIVGLTRSQATAAIVAAGLVVGTVVEQFNSSFPPETVLSQNPAPGTTVASGTAVGFSVSIGAGTVAVPSLVGLQQSVAQAAILAAGLTLGPVTTLPSTEIPAGQVIAQTPAAGAVVTLGTQVGLTVSAGSLLVLVPSLVGLTQAAAVLSINAAGLELGTVTLRSSATVPAGVVIAQTPVAGVGVSSGSTVDLVVSSGLTQTPVPNVIGLSLVAAEQAILLAGLAVGTITEQTNPAVPAGQVFNQSPAPGTLAAPGTNVNLTVSAGPGLVTVPDVVGLMQAAAQTVIVSAGLVVGDVTEQPSGTAPPGTVIVQVPPAGVTAPLGSDVDLVVATTLQQVIVPNVVGLTESAASAALLIANLTVGNIIFQTSSTVPAGQVISQSPSAGSLVFPNTAINLVISTGFGQAFVPNVVGLTSLAAQAAILGAGLTVGAIIQQANPLVPAGIVISQNPAAGNIVPAGAPVSLVVSTGPTSVFVPNVLGLTSTAAEAAIVTSGLIVGNVTTRFSSTIPAGRVLEQDPTGGTAVTPGSAVDLVVATGVQNVSVPNVVGLTVQAASTAITSVGLVVGTITERSSTTVPAGSVISQSPGAGSTVPSGTRVNLVVSTGAVQTAVPNLVGLTLSQARLSITLAGFTVGSVTAVESSLPVNQVIAQSPLAGTLASPGSAVNITISAGIAPATVPNLIGLSRVVAQQVLELNGFVLGLVNQRPDPLAPEGTVLDQQPDPGVLAPAGSAINLVVSQGLVLAEVPDVVGMLLEQAQDLIEDAGLVVGDVDQEQSQEPAGEVLSQFPLPGVEISAGASVDLVVSQGASELSRPLNLTASQGTFSEFVRLSWDAVEGATQYEIFRGETPDLENAVALATVAETTYDDTDALPPTTETVSPGCFAPPEDVVDFVEHFYWVQALSATAESELTGPETGFRGLPEPRGLEMARVMALPSRGLTGSLLNVQPGDTFAMRLSHPDGLDPSSVWGVLTVDGTLMQHEVRLRINPDSSGRDGWAVLDEEMALTPGQVVRFAAGATSMLGAAVTGSRTFFVRRAAESEKALEVWQPAAIDRFAADETHLKAAASAGLPELPEGVGPAYFIEPHDVYHAPQRVWLPVPEPFNPEDLELYVLIADTGGSQWWPASRVLGFAVPGETLAADINGMPHLGVAVRHGATVRLGHRLPEPVAIAQSFSDDIALAGVAIVSLIGAAFVSKVSRRETI